MRKYRSQISSKNPYTWVKNTFGNHRGLIRFILSWLRMVFGSYKKLHKIDWSQVRRLVFVCQGNICRSAYAQSVAANFVPEVTSFGLSTTTGALANPTAQKIAAEMGIELADHKDRMLCSCPARLHCKVVSVKSACSLFSQITSGTSWLDSNIGYRHIGTCHDQTQAFVLRFQRSDWVSSIKATPRGCPDDPQR